MGLTKEQASRRYEAEIKEIRQRWSGVFQCEHEETLLVKSPHINSYWHQCQRCGHKQKVAASKLTERERATCKEFDPNLEEEYREKSRQKGEALRAEQEAAYQRYVEAIDESNAKWWQWYNQYLKTPEWKAKRSKVLARAKGICEGCGVYSASQVHHLTYDRAGDEMLFDLVAVCWECHQKLHPDKDMG